MYRLVQRAAMTLAGRVEEYAWEIVPTPSSRVRSSPRSDPMDGSAWMRHGGAGTAWPPRVASRGFGIKSWRRN